jgi:hypothetical protein
MLQSKVIYRRNSMAIYTVQCGFIDTDGSISVVSRDFEAADKSDADNKAHRFFTAQPQISQCDASELLFSVPRKQASGGGVTIGGSSAGATIVTGNGNVVSQSGKYNIHVGRSTPGMHIGDSYS